MRSVLQECPGIGWELQGGLPSPPAEPMAQDAPRPGGPHDHRRGPVAQDASGPGGPHDNRRRPMAPVSKRSI